jgi:GMP synthase (glutamine-hydrolysing)
MPAVAKVLVLQHVAVEGPGRLGAALVRAGLELEIVPLHAGAPVPAAIGGAAALVVMGGPMGVYQADRHPHLTDELRLIGQAVAAGVPTIGICLGSQLLAAALGAAVAPCGRQEIGWLPVTLDDGAAGDPLLGGIAASFAPLHWHGDVFALPAGAVALARSAMTELQAFRAGERAWGFLFHLEADAAQVAAMADSFRHDLDGAGVDADALVAASPAAAAAIAAIADQVFDRFAAIARG